MSQPCSIEMCKNPLHAQCYCCTKNFCRNHFYEHDNLPNIQLNSLVDEINSLNNRLMEFTIDKLTGDSRQKLERWRVSYHEIIDDIFEEKCREINQCTHEKIEQQRNEIHKMRSTATELIRKQETTMNDIDLLKATVRKVEEKINKMEQTCFEVVVRPLVIDNSLIHIKELYVPHLDLPILPPPYKTINHVYDSSLVIATNDRFFLIHQVPNLCLIDRDFTVFKTSQWNDALIWDMCWSSTLARFFVITEANVFIVDDNTMSIERIHMNQNQRWRSCTCSDTSLFLSTFNHGSSISKFSLSSPMQLENHWKSPESCAKDQMILNVVYKNETLAITIVDVSTKDKLIELRSVVALKRLWSFRLDIEHSTCLTRCCSLNHGDWLAWNCYTKFLLHITKDGKLQATSKYDKIPLYVILFDGDQLAISTADDINFHKIKP